MKKFILSGVLSGFLVPLAVQAQEAPHVAPDVRDIPVLLENIKFTGSGSYLSLSNGLFFVTAAHCLFNLTTGELASATNTLTSYEHPTGTNKAIFGLDMSTLLANDLIKRDPNHDIAVAKMGDIISNSGGPIAWQPGPGVTGGGNVNYSDVLTGGAILFNEIIEGDSTYIAGYPKELAKIDIGEVDLNSPLVRGGLIAQKNYIKTKLIIDSAIYPGNSGGPLFVVKHRGSSTSYQIAGVIVKYQPVPVHLNDEKYYTNAIVNSGYGVAEPIDYAIDLMRQILAATNNAIRPLPANFIPLPPNLLNGFTNLPAITNDDILKQLGLPK
jgi:hypothetical protein